MSHGGMFNFVTGRTGQTRGGTIRKLRDWYLWRWAAGGEGLTPEAAEEYRRC